MAKIRTYCHHQVIDQYESQVEMRTCPMCDRKINVVRHNWRCLCGWEYACSRCEASDG